MCLAKKRVRTARLEGEGASGGLRPVKDVIERIFWDPSLSVDEFIFGYTDRFEGLKEASCSAPNENVKGKERQLVKAIPEHRIEYIKYRERVVWHKAQRVDLVFGTGSIAGDDGNRMKIDAVIASYDEWLVEKEASKQQSVTVSVDLGVLCDFDAGVRLLLAKPAAQLAPKELWASLTSNPGAAAGTHFPSFTGIKVQILTQLPQPFLPLFRGRLAAKSCGPR